MLSAPNVTEFRGTVREAPLARFILLLALLLALPAPLVAQDARLLTNVRGEFDEPLAGVRIEVMHANGGGLVGECRTNASGECVVATAPRRSYIVRALLTGYIPAQIEAQPPAGDVAVSVHLTSDLAGPLPSPDPSLTIAEGAIVGEVRAPDGAPIPDVSIDVLSDGMYRGTTGRTGTDGSFRISVIPGTYTIRSSPKILFNTGQVFDGVGYDLPITVTARNVTGRVILYPRSFALPTIDITVVTRGGKPVPGADVREEIQGPSISGTRTSMFGTFKTGPDGAVPRRAVLPGTVTITASAIVDGAPMAGIATVDLAGAPLEVLMTLSPAAQLTGRVEFFGRQRPLHNGDGLRVLEIPGRGKGGYSSADTNGIVGADGEFVLTGLIGERRLILQGVPSGWRLVEVTHYGQPLGDSPIVFRGGEKVDGLVFRVEPTPR